MSEPLEEFLGWLEREEREHGFAAVERGMEDLESMQELLWDELGYDINEKQFARLSEASSYRYKELAPAGVVYKEYEHPWGWQPTYRYEPTGQWISPEAAFGLAALERLKGKG